jgi:hypothetical protein
LDIPQSLINGDPSIYRLLIDVEPVTAGTELYGDDNLTLNGGLHAIVNQFGTISFKGVSRTGATIKYHDPVSHDLVTLGFKGAGHGEISLDNGIADLSISATTASSQLMLTTAGHASFHQLDVTDTIGTLNLRAASFDGPMAISGGAKTVLLGDVGGDNLLSIGAFLPLNAQKLSLTLGRATDLSIESSQAIGTFSAIDWRDTTGSDDSLLAPSIGTLKITGSKTPSVAGDFEANVTTYGEQALGSISVAGAIRNATIKTNGNIGAVNVGGMEHSNIFAGVSGRPNTLADFAEPHSIGSFTVHAIAGVANQFVDSQVAAAKISKIVVRGVEPDDSGTKFGFIADKVESYFREGFGHLSNLAAAKTADSSTDYELVIL